MIKDRKPKVGFLPQSCKEELLVPKSSSNSKENNNSRSDDCNDIYEKDKTRLQPKILTLSKTVAKVLMNPSINVSVCIPKENTKTETFSTFVEETQFKMSESEAFV
ncbi:hypothetical protein JTE90_018534 [Oedothorax gibbosus]|uniref:Uncharacterized protein n=1 Tax=Oedothorax gibbosus TaxID=931172 RepID=A0AAV6V4X6_9ARAC|nr:hypothetical protein JTE90_018534 [Oedothorax gibbosus]